MRNCLTQHFGDARVAGNRWALWLAISLLLPLAAIPGCDLLAGSAVQQPSAGTGGANILTVNVARATLSENVRETTSAYGTIKPRRSSSLGFARAGRVKNVFFQVGDLVSEGDKIAELDQGELVNQQEDLDSVLNALNDDLKLLESGTDIQGQRRKQEEIAELTNQQTRLTREFQKGFIVAPYRGVIAERNAEVGDAVPAGRPFFRILDAAEPIVELNVPVELAKLITVGTQVRVEREETPLMATVTTKSPELNSSSRTQAVTLSFANEPNAQNLNYGEVVEVQFLIDTQRDGIWMPYSALQSAGNGLWTAYVLEGEGEQQTVAPRRIELVQLEDKRALVQGSLNEGDLFVVDGLNRVVPGQLVKANDITNSDSPAQVAGAGE